MRIPYTSKVKTGEKPCRRGYQLNIVINQRHGKQCRDTIGKGGIVRMKQGDLEGRSCCQNHRK